MFLAIFIVALQLYLIRLCSPVHQKNILVKPWVYWLIFFTLIVTFFQLFLGTQVREDMDLLEKSGITQANWDDNFSLVYFIHRSFSWLVLILIAGIYWYNRKNDKIRLINWTFYFLAMELILGVALGNFNVPGLIRTFHLMLATFLISTLILSIYRMKIIKQNTI
jgi:cytochrome c oxidase assembly protein subunit 15